MAMAVSEGISYGRHLRMPRAGAVATEPGIWAPQPTGQAGDGEESTMLREVVSEYRCMSCRVSAADWKACWKGGTLRLRLGPNLILPA